MIRILACLLFVQLNALAQSTGNNVVYGEIELRESQSVFKKGSGYNKDGTKVMHSSDPLADPKLNVIVSLHPLSFKPNLEPTPNAVVTQKEQTFLPHVLPVTVGSTVYFLNEDQFYHSIYSLSHRNINIPKTKPGISRSQKIKKKGIVKLTCDIHTHMSGMVLSLDTPYFTRVDKYGRYRLENLPDGEYRIEVFHPEEKKLQEVINLSNGFNLEKNFNYLKP